MNNSRQIALISTMLGKERECYLFELSKVISFMEKKIATIKKMISYQNDYYTSEHLQLSRSVPALNKNLNAFSRKMTDVIQQAEQELVQLQKNKDKILSSIEDVDNKIRLMNLFADRVKLQAMLQTERREQSEQDELTSRERLRGEHE
ncbi:MAG: hypothetical protein ABI597_01045 [Gammaproteobacteria bacterium]